MEQVEPAQASEFVDVLNDSGKVIATISRADAERDNHTTENVLIFVFTSHGKVWVQLRPKTKNHYPGRWDISACGGIVSGEDRDAAAARETQEEMGITPELRYVESFLNIFPGDNGEVRRRLSHLYIGVSDDTPQPSAEVDEFKCLEAVKLRADVHRRPAAYIPSFIVELDKAVAAYQLLYSKA
ncbi:MAG TPA: NUDIX domain-containing protein [Candidatus Saccharimonadales bacterium]|nr:NUDIX domain-containing protein [Candidatus Saccharimonadales bacterium]